MVNFAITQARSLVPPEATLLIWKGHHRGNIRIPETETPDQAIALVPDMKCEAVAEFPMRSSEGIGFWSKFSKIKCEGGSRWTYNPSVNSSLHPILTLVPGYVLKELLIL